MPDKHAILSASSSMRWLHCTPSARLEAAMPESTSEYAEEGTRAHALAEKRLKHFLNKGTMLKKKPKDIDEEMWEATGRYVDTCVEKINAARAASPDAQIGVEVRLDYSDWVPGGFGTGDCVIVSDKSIEVIDLKYGKGVPVSAEGNTQMRLYALGALAKYSLLYECNEANMTIVQPRLDSVSSDVIRIEDLYGWGDEIKSIAELADKGEGERKAGDWCRFCKARNTCRALHDEMLRGVKADLSAADLSPEEIADVLIKSKDIKRWLDGLEEYALGKALNGDEIPHMKIVEGRSNRRIVDEAKAADVLSHEYGDQIYRPRELLTLTGLEKLAGKKHLTELIGAYIDKPKGKPTLVADTDKRPPMEIEAASKDDFDDGLLNLNFEQ